jgi:hypothetical protein
MSSAMRRTILLSVLALAGCVPTPDPQPLPVPAPVTLGPQPQGGLIGLTAGDLAQRFGTPALQIREGVGLKLQFRGGDCVLDAYLYPPPGAALPERVAHVDTRLRSGARVDQASCVARLRPS